MQNMLKYALTFWRNFNGYLYKINKILLSNTNYPVLQVFFTNFFKIQFKKMCFFL